MAKRDEQFNMGICIDCGHYEGDHEALNYRETRWTCDDDGCDNLIGYCGE